MIKLSLVLLVEGNVGLNLLQNNIQHIRHEILMAISLLNLDIANTSDGKNESRALILDKIDSALKKLDRYNPVRKIYYDKFKMQ